MVFDQHILNVYIDFDFFQLASSRRRSGRIARKVLGEKVNFGNSHMTTHYTTSTNQNDTFSQTTLGSCVQSGGVCNASTMESYHEFEVSKDSDLTAFFLLLKNNYAICNLI